MNHRSRTSRYSLVIAGLALSLTAGCSSSHKTAATTSTPVAVNTPTPSPSPTATGTTVTGTATDEQGDALSVNFTLNPAVAASTLNNDAVQQCGNDLESVGSSLDRALAVHFTIRFQVTSSLSTPVHIDLSSGLHQVTTDGTGGTGPADQMPYWAMNYSDSSSCDTPGDFNPGNNNWNNAEPAAQNQGSGWLILPNAISPDDPDGSLSYASRIVIIPTVHIGIALATLTLDHTDTVTCLLPDPAAGNTQYIAVNRSMALSHGCGGTD